ncbi:hypothetical protein [Algoriphagus sp.]|uniref:hypothetical protein n=1 Tax=Algoriphagus sp. TaxID=1872435 RepID=UPI00391BE996
MNLEIELAKVRIARLKNWKIEKLAASQLSMDHGLFDRDFFNYSLWTMDYRP